MRELGLTDLADRFRDDRAGFDAAFEQGRRSFHHKDDQRNAVASLVGLYETEARNAEAGGAHYAAMIMYGAACEARLLVMVLDFPDRVDAALARLPSTSRPRGGPMRWTLDDLIGVARQAGWLAETDVDGDATPTVEWATTLKLLRNLQHPGRHARERPHVAVGESQVHDARSIYVMLCTALGRAASSMRQQG